MSSNTSQIWYIISNNPNFNWQEQRLSVVMSRVFVTQYADYANPIQKPNLDIQPFQKVIYLPVKNFFTIDQGFLLAEHYRATFIDTLDRIHYKQIVAFEDKKFKRVLRSLKYRRGWLRWFLETYPDEVPPNYHDLITQAEAYTYDDFCKFAKRTLALAKIEFFDSASGRAYSE